MNETPILNSNLMKNKRLLKHFLIWMGLKLSRLKFISSINKISSILIEISTWKHWKSLPSSVQFGLFFMLLRFGQTMTADCTSGNFASVTILPFGICNFWKIAIFSCQQNQKRCVFLIRTTPTTSWMILLIVVPQLRRRRSTPKVKASILFASMKFTAKFSRFMR